MKKILLLFAAMICAVAGWAQDATVSATVKGQKLEVGLNNAAEDFVAFQMDITLPAGVEVAENGAVAIDPARLTPKSGTITIGDSEATLNFVVVYNQIDATHVRVIAYNFENRAIEGHDGALFNMSFTGTPGANFELANVKFVTVTELNEVDLGAISSTIGDAFVPGDINRDGEPTVSDITCLIRIINNDNVLSSWNLEAADCNLDGVPSVSDVTVLINLINNYGK